MDKELDITIPQFIPRERIPKGTFELMLSTAIFIDLLIQPVFGIMPFIGPFLNFFVVLIASLTFWFWFKFRGVGFFTGRVMRKFAAFIGTLFAEMLFGFIPGYTLMIIFVVKAVQWEDELYNKHGIEIEKTIENVFKPFFNI